MLAAVTVNTLVKGVMAAVLGSRPMARSVAAILGPAAVLGLVAWLLV